MRSVFLVILFAQLAFAEDANDCKKRGGTWKLEGISSGCSIKGKRDGVWRDVAAGGQLIEETSWKLGKRDGPSVGYFINCQIRWRGGWLNGQRDGEWSEWALDGKKISKGSYTKGVRVGEWTTFHPQSGEKHLVGPYASGLMNGTFKEHLISGEAWRDVEFRGGERFGEKQAACTKLGGRWFVDLEEPGEGCLIAKQRSGEWTTFDGHGKRRAVKMYVKGVLNGVYTDYHPTGEVLRQGKYVDGLPEGVHEFRAVDGTLLGRSTVTKGTGEWKTWHPTGKLGLHGRYVQGCPEGRWHLWDEEGQLIVEDTYANCQRNGLYVDYNEGGIPRRSGHFVDGQEQGEWTQKWKNGKTEWQGMYEKGERTGEWRFYRWDGTLYRVGPFAGDQPEGEWTHFFANGKPEATGLNEGGKAQGAWKLNWSTGQAWREPTFDQGNELSDAAESCREWVGRWESDPEKGTLGCLVCRAKEDDTITQVGMGLWSFWHSDGTLEKRGTLVDGKPTGHWQYFHDNGQVMLEGEFDGGVEEGSWRGFYRSGQQRFVGGYVGGKPDGEWTSNFPDGGLLSIGAYVGGQKSGTWKYLTKGRPEEVVFVPDAGATAATPGDGGP